MPYSHRPTNLETHQRRCHRMTPEDWDVFNSDPPPGSSSQVLDWTSGQGDLSISKNYELVEGYNEEDMKNEKLFENLVNKMSIDGDSDDGR